MATVIQVKRGTASSWTSANTVLAAGEIGFESDTKKMKVGDGSTAWTSLLYVGAEGDITAVVAGTGLSGGSTSGSATLSIDTATTVDKTTAQTLTNKTLTSPVLTTPSISTMTTTGDILYASAANTPARLGIGSTGQSLVVASGIPSWATPSSGALTKIVTGTFTAVANTSTTFDGCFTSTYRNYLVVFNGGASADNELYVQNRVAGVTQSALQYYGGRYGVGYTGANNTFQWSNSPYYSPIHLPTGAQDNSCTITFSKVGNSSQQPGFHSSGYSNANNGLYVAGGITANSYNADGFILSVPTGTITGTCVVYGLAN